MIALVVTVAALPLLVLDLLGGHSGASTEVSAVSTEVPESSLVVAVSPSEASSSTSSTSAPPATAAPVTTAAPPATAKPKATTTTTAPKATTTTTAAPKVAAPSGPVPTASESTFLACIRQRESHGDYSVVDPTGTFMGAYQIYQGGWDAVARNLGRTDLVGVRPNTASPADQDAIALQMMRMYGRTPWGGACG